MNFTQKAGFFIFWFLIFTYGNGQTVYKEYNYGIKEGLNSENIHKTIIAPSGELYISTQRGISIYDGYRFIAQPNLKTNVLGFYFKENKFYFCESKGLSSIENIYSAPQILVPSIPTDSNPNNEHYENTFVDSNHRIWCTDFEHIKYYDLKSKKIISFLYDQGNKNLNLNIDFIEVDKNKIWAATPNGLWIWSELSGKLELHPNKLINQLSFIAGKKLKNGNVMLSTLDGKIIQINPKTNQTSFLKSLPDNQMVLGFEENENKLLIYSTKSVYLFHNQNYTEIYKTDKQSIHHLTYNSETRIIWLSTSKGLVKLLPANPAIEVYKFQTNNLPIISITQDAKNNIWALDTEGKVWRKFFNDFELIYKSETEKLFSISYSKGNIFLSGSDGIKIFQNNHFEKLNLKELNAGSEIIKTFITPQNELWVVFSTQEFGRYHWPTLEKINHKFNNPAEFWIDNKWQDIMIDRNNRIWLAGWMPKSYGICYFDPETNEFTDVSQKSINPDRGKFVGDFYTKIGLGNNQTMLFSAFGGLNRTDKNGKIIQKVDVFDYKIADTHFRGIAEDLRGNIYFATTEGLHIYRKKIDEVVRLSQIDGLPTNYLVHSFFKLNDQKIAMGTNDGLVIVDMEKALKTQLTDKLKFTQINVNGNPRNFKSYQIELQKHERDLELLFSDLSFLDSEKVSFRYKFSDEKNWHELRSDPKLSLNHLQPGDYNIEIQVTDNLGNLQSKELKIDITALPPFTKSNLFYALLVFTGLLIIFLINQYLWKKREEEQRYLRRIKEAEMQTLRSQMNPHFLFNTLNSINSYIIQNKSETASVYLTTFSKLMRNILDNSKHEMISLQKEMQTLKLYLELESARLEHSFDYKFEIDSKIDSEYLQIPPLIIQPFTENAIWHGLRNKTNKGLLEVIVKEIDDETLQIFVQDNGIGREASKKLKKEQTQHKSYGIEITTERLKNLDSNNSVEIVDLYNADETSAGTQIIITLKLKEND